MVFDAAKLLDGETDTDRLRNGLAATQADLQRHASALAKLHAELAASRLEVAGARGETVQYQGFFRQAQAQAESAHAHIAELRAHAIRREAEVHADIVTLNTGIADLRAEIAALRASFSWRVTRPVRAAGWRARMLKARLIPAASPVTVPAATPAGNEPYTFKPAPVTDDAAPIVTLDGLHHLSRSL